MNLVSMFAAAVLTLCAVPTAYAQAFAKMETPVGEVPYADSFETGGKPYAIAEKLEKLEDEKKTSQAWRKHLADSKACSRNPRPSRGSAIAIFVLWGADGDGAQMTMIKYVGHFVLDNEWSPGNSFGNSSMAPPSSSECARAPVKAVHRNELRTVTIEDLMKSHDAKGDSARGKMDARYRFVGFWTVEDNKALPENERLPEQMFRLQMYQRAVG